MSQTVLNFVNGDRLYETFQDFQVEASVFAGLLFTFLVLQVNNNLSQRATKSGDELTITGKKKEQKRTAVLGQTSASSCLSTTDTKPNNKCDANIVARNSLNGSHDKLEVPGHYWSVTSYLAYCFLVTVGYIREFIYGQGPIDTKIGRETNRKGYPLLYSSFEGFYTRNIFRRYKPVIGRAISCAPGATTRASLPFSEDHFWTTKLGENFLPVINMSSYNYLGYAQSSGPCTDEALRSIHEYGLSSASPDSEIGAVECNHLLNKTVAEFLGTEDAITCGMGFATNSLNIPSLIQSGGNNTQNTLVISDELNHASLILGIRLSGAYVQVYKHGDNTHLEHLIRSAIIKGHPRTRRPWHKIIVFVEGVYSMEGTIVDLPSILALKKKYNFYLYLDEAHSVGAMGPKGRGVVDYFGISPKDIDIMMGTFTKSFGSAGGYIAGSKRFIQYMQASSQSIRYATSVSPPVAHQIIAAMDQIMNPDIPTGRIRIRRLAENSVYFRQRLREMGLIVYGDDNSPVVPCLLIIPTKIKSFVKILHEEYGVAVVSVGFPAVAMTRERARFCMSSAHTREQLDYVLDAVNEVADKIHLRYSQQWPVTYKPKGHVFNKETVTRLLQENENIDQLKDDHIHFIS